MKKVYSTVSILIGIGGFVFAQQSGDPVIDNYKKKLQPDIRIYVQNDLDENGNIQKMDSSFTWNWSGEVEIPDDLHEKIQDLFKNFNHEFYFDFNDTTIFPGEIHRFFEKDLRWMLENLPYKTEIFDKEFQKRLEEKLKKLNDVEFHFKWDENFDQRLKERLEELQERLEHLYQKQIPSRGKAI